MKLALIHFNHIQTATGIGWPDLRHASWTPNYGDMLVCAALMRLLSDAPLGDRTPSPRFDFGNIVPADCPIDHAVIRGSTYLHNQFDFAAANRTLDSLKVPVSIIGLGAQNPVSDPSFLDQNQEARAFIARLNERSQSISVRGAFSAEVVARLGGKSIRITGCPSLFYSRKAPVVRLPELLARPERRLGVSLHTGLSKNIYCRDATAALHKHCEAIAFAKANSSSMALFEQGVKQEFDVADRNLGFGRRMAAAEAIRQRICGPKPPGFTPYDLVAGMVSLHSIEEWLARARDLEALIGFRFHGNMVGLLQGSPCYYYVYDSRMLEFCALYGLPYQDVAEPFYNPVTRMMEHDWDHANRRIAACFSEMQAFFAENGLKMAS